MSGLNIDLGLFDALDPLGFPQLLPVPAPVSLDFRPVPFSKSGSVSAPSGCLLHFYEDDTSFARVWSSPSKYIERFKKFDHIIQPDFSLYFDYPQALQIYNKYRNHWLARYYSSNGSHVIPNIRLSAPSCWLWSFFGYPAHSVVAFSDIGISHDKLAMKILSSGFDLMVKRLDPIQILYFTRSNKYAPSECDVVEVPFYG